MKADEIRKTPWGPGNDSNYPIFVMLREIAAQLADLNEHLKKVDESVFGAKV